MDESDDTKENNELMRSKNDLNALKTTGRVINPTNYHPIWKSGTRHAIFSPTNVDPAVSKNRFRMNSDVLIPQYIPCPVELNLPPRIINKPIYLMSKLDKWYFTFNQMKSENREYENKQQSKADLKLLASVNLRTGQKLKEGYNHFKMAILSENKQDYTQAIHEYKIFLTTAEELKDVIALNLGYNSLGICYHMNCIYNKAMEYYLKHLEVSSDASSVIALVNLGLLFRQLGEIPESISRLREAYRLSLDIDDPALEGLSSGHLGYSLTESNDVDELREAPIHLGRHLTICGESLNHPGALTDVAARDPVHMSNTFQKLGHVSLKLGDIRSAMSHFDRSKELSINSSRENITNVNKMCLGICQTSLIISDYIESCKQILPCDINGRILNLCKLTSSLQCLPDAPISNEKYSDHPIHHES